MLLALLSWGVCAIGVQQGFLQPVDDYVVMEYHEMRVVDKDSGTEEVTIYQKSQKADKNFGPEAGFAGQGALGMEGSFGGQDMPRGPPMGGMGSGSPCGCADMGDDRECGCHDKGDERDAGIFGGPMIGKDDEECHEGCPFGFGSDSQPGPGGDMNGFMPPDIFQGNGLAVDSHSEGMGPMIGKDDEECHEGCPFGFGSDSQPSPGGDMNGFMPPDIFQGNGLAVGSHSEGMGPMIGKDGEECHEGCPFGFGSDSQPSPGGDMNGFIPPDIFQLAGSNGEGMKGDFDHGHEDWDTENCPFGGDGHKQNPSMGNNGIMGPRGLTEQMGPSQGNVIMPDPMIMMGGNNMMPDPSSMMGGNNMMPDPMSMMGGNNIMPDPMSMMGGNNMMPGSQSANNFGEDPFGGMAGPNSIIMQDPIGNLIKGNSIIGYSEGSNSMMDSSLNSLLGSVGESNDENGFSNQKLIDEDQFSLENPEKIEEAFSDMNLDDLKEDDEGEDLEELMDMMEDFMESFEDGEGVEGFVPNEDVEDENSELCNNEEDVEEILGKDYDELIVVVADEMENYDEASDVKQEKEKLDEEAEEKQKLKKDDE